MSKRDDLFATYAADLRNKCKVQPDMALLTRVTIGCGPAIYNADSATVAGSDASELDTVRKNFLMKKLGLPDSPALAEAIRAVIDTHGRSERNKHRADVYILPKSLDEKVARLHLKKIGVKLTELRRDQADYIGVAVEGPFKSDHYRY